MRTIALLPNQTLILALSDPLASVAEARTIVELVKEALPDWNTLVVANGQVVDLRGDEEATALAGRLMARIEAAAPHAPGTEG